MQKPLFSVEEACLLGWEQSPAVLKLQLHQWAKTGDLVRLKRGVYGFPEQIKDKTDVARVLYGPAYVSLEYALHQYGLLPDVVFAFTLVGPKGTKKFLTPFGLFIYRKIRKDLFWGYDPITLMGEREKALVDYFYLNGAKLFPKADFWETGRWQNLETIDFEKARSYAHRSKEGKVLRLIESLEQYGRNHGKA